MKLGVIGYGHRLRHMVNQFKKQDENCLVTAIADLCAAKFAQEEEIAQSGARLYTDYKEMLEKEALDAVAIGTRCSLHTQIAMDVLKLGLPLFLEKPVSTSYEDLDRLYQAGLKSSSQVVVSFPLRGSELVVLAKEIIDSGKLGAIEHVQAVNNVPYGGIYYQGWYRDEQETGGLFLQKSTHDFDYINFLLGQKPVMIAAMNSKQIFKGDMPAGLYCKDCAKKETCPESAVQKTRDEMFVPGEQCCFAADTGNEDSGSALVRYESGMHAVYSQNFFARNGAQARGARLLGYKGTLEFDFYTGVLKVYMHHTNRTETYTLGESEGHHGGDAALARNFVDVVNKNAKSQFDLNAGIFSALMCLRARQSAQSNTFQTIDLSEGKLHE